MHHVPTGPIFFLFATPEWRWLIAGAYIVWIAYAGLNIGLDNIKLKLVPADNNWPFVAVYYAVADFANGHDDTLRRLGARSPRSERSQRARSTRSCLSPVSSGEYW